MVLGHTDVILCAVTGRHHLCAAQWRTEEEGLAFWLSFFICAKLTVGEEAQVEEERWIRGGGSFTPSDAPLDIMLLCVDLVLRGKFLK